MVDRDLEMLEQFYEEFLRRYVETMRKEAMVMERYGMRAGTILGETKFGTNAQEKIVQHARNSQQLLDEGEAELQKRLMLVRYQIERRKALEQTGAVSGRSR